jgi:carbonic anhydrase/acetyltransferase-like protein (isoleucine patch superfamily)
MMDPIARTRGIVLRLSCPLFYKRIGAGTSFHGRVRLPLPFRNVMIGARCMVGDAVFFQTGRRSQILIGDDCSINSGCHLVASEQITIGDNVAIAEYVSIRDSEHGFSTESGVRGQAMNVSPISIAANVWIGRGAYIGPGVTLSSGTIVGANSVVRAGVYPPNVLIAGTPAVIKKSLA